MGKIAPAEDYGASHNDDAHTRRRNRARKRRGEDENAEKRVLTADDIPIKKSKYNRQMKKKVKTPEEANSDDEEDLQNAVKDDSWLKRNEKRARKSKTHRTKTPVEKASAKRASKEKKEKGKAQEQFKETEAARDCGEVKPEIASL